MFHTSHVFSLCLWLVGVFVLFRCVCVVQVCLCCSGVFGVKVEVKSVSVMEGENVTLHTNVTELQTDHVIKWRFENIPIATIKRSRNINPTYNKNKTEIFSGRLGLNNQTGDLTITHITSQHSGLYKLRINISDEPKVKKNITVTVNDQTREDEITYADPTFYQHNTKTKRVKEENEIQKMLHTLLVLSLCSWLFGVFGDEVKMSVMEGHSVTLHTNVTELYTHEEMYWWFKNIRIARIRRSVNINPTYNDETEIFRDRLKMNNQTGDLTITNIRAEHSGRYKLNILGRNKETAKTFSLTVNDSDKHHQHDEENTQTHVNNKVYVYLVHVRMLLPVSLFLALSLNCVFGDEVKMSVMEGHSVTLHTNVTELYTHEEMYWWFKNIRIARIRRSVNINPTYNDETEIFRDRLKMNNQTGDLTITNIRAEHSGRYKLNILGRNKETAKTFSLTVNGETHLVHIIPLSCAAVGCVMIVASLLMFFICRKHTNTRQQQDHEKQIICCDSTFTKHNTQ
ncbi:hypothetical protein IRJ41_000580, partial [Triplophysa rosa]